MVKRVGINELTKGMRLASGVSTAFGAALASGGDVVDDALIALLRSNRVRSVEIAVSEEEQKQDILGGLRILSAAMKFSRNQYVFSDEQEVSEMADNILAIIQADKACMEYIRLLTDLKDYSEVVFSHSANVAFLCYKFADWRFMVKERKEELVLAALLHDIGKMQLPLRLAESRKMLSESEFSIMKKHAINGYMMLKESPVPEIIKRPVLDHHERCDGTGYPMGYTFTKISEYGRMIAIADDYESLASKSTLTGRLCPLRIATIMLSESEGKYDKSLAEDFFNNLLKRYLGRKVKLSNGYVAKLIAVNTQDIVHPTIELSGQVIDLSMDHIKKSNIQVVGIVFD